MAKRLSLTASKDWMYRHFFIQAESPPRAWIRGECNVAIWRSPTPFCPRLQRLCARLALLWRVIHDKARTNQAIPGAMCKELWGALEKLVLCCTGVCLEEKDMKEWLFQVSDLEEAANILLPQTPDKLRELMRFSFSKPVKLVPTYFLTDFIKVMCTDFIEEKRGLIRAILKGRQLPDLPRISQETLIIWGEEDQIFPLELVVIHNAGHAVNLEKSKEFIKHIKTFLLDTHDS
ncbi:serine protease [Lithospermum erythrorhizon]|uniref:Serine protease n=1 Tax=Lithospermum erythrorhizon TaxID=34254 RepID=A0AAV3R7W8_LITER